MTRSIEKLQFITQDVENRSHLEQIKLAIKGGCTWVQLRLKDKPEEEVLAVAREARKITADANVVLIINDYPEIAKAVAADGVHLGKNDCSPAKARLLLGDSIIIGATANTIDDIQRLARHPIDYLGVGPYKFTKTKKNLSPVLGLDGYRRIVESCKQEGFALPMVGIGSVEVDDIQPILQTGMYGVAVSSVIAKSADPIQTTINLLNEIVCENSI